MSETEKPPTVMVDEPEGPIQKWVGELANRIALTISAYAHENPSPIQPASQLAKVATQMVANGLEMTSLDEAYQMLQQHLKRVHAPKTPLKDDHIGIA